MQFAESVIIAVPLEQQYISKWDYLIFRHLSEISQKLFANFNANR